MRTFDEQKIVSMAANASAVSNGKKISTTGGFVRRMKSEDDSFYLGECKGSGKSNYIVSIDFFDSEDGVFRCSCPSRQFPCKHGIALMFEMNQGKDFEIGNIPQDIIDKRNKKEATKQKKEENADKPKKKSATSKAARTKKINKQLEGLIFLKNLTDRLVNAGLATVSSMPLTEYKALSKQLGDSYLPGIGNYFNHLIAELEKNQKSKSPDYDEALSLLIKLRYLNKRATDYLNKKLESDEVSLDDNLLYEELGGIWKLEELNELGLKKENVRLVQLSFEVDFDEVKKEFTDKGYWIDLNDGEIGYSANFRPVKAVKYINQDDSFFGLKEVDILSYYPGFSGENRRIRWESARDVELSKSDIAKINAFAVDSIADISKEIKNELKNTLSDNAHAVLLRFKKIAFDDETLVLVDNNSHNIILSTKGDDRTVLEVLQSLPDKTLLKDNIMFGLTYYNSTLKQLCIEPRSIITSDDIVRLKF